MSYSVKDKNTITFRIKQKSWHYKNNYRVANTFSKNDYFADYIYFGRPQKNIQLALTLKDGFTTA
jgi:hypothetical protein